MLGRQKKHFGIADHAVMMRRKKHSFLDDVDAVVDWRPIFIILALNKLK